MKQALITILSDWHKLTTAVNVIKQALEHNIEVIDCINQSTRSLLEDMVPSLHETDSGVQVLFIMLSVNYKASDYGAALV